MVANRIPECNSTDFSAMSCWFEALASKGLLFHPEDDPEDIIELDSGLPTFTPDEVLKVRNILSEFFEANGNQVVAACYPIFMTACGLNGDC